MRGDQGRREVAHIVFAPQVVDGAAVVELDATVENGARELVIDFSETTRVDDEAVLLLDWLAQRLENAGGKLLVIARRAPEGAHSTRTLRAGDLTCVLGVHAALDKAILHRLTAGAGGAASW